MPYWVFVAVALAIHALVNFMVFVKRDNSPASKWYRLFLISIALFYIVDVLWGVFDANKWSVALYVDTFVYFVLMGATILLWTSFVTRYLNGKKAFSLAVKWIGVAFFAAEIILLIVNMFTPVLFSVDGNAVYHSYMARDIMLYVQIAMYAIVICYSFFYTIKAHATEFRRYIAICLFSFVMIVCIAIQISDPLIPFYSIGLLIGDCILNTYLLNDTAERLRTAVKQTSKVAEEREEELGKALTIAYQDALTGVHSRHSFVEEEMRIDALIAKKLIGNFAVVVFDINGLKETNDRLGHDAGDQLIIESCHLITSCFPEDAVFRYGGDEFVAVLTGEDYEKRQAYHNRFAKLMDRNAVHGGPVIASGLARFRPETDFSLKSVFYRADKMMYSRKEHLKDAPPDEE